MFYPNPKSHKKKKKTFKRSNCHLVRKRYNRFLVKVAVNKVNFNSLQHHLNSFFYSAPHIILYYLTDICPSTVFISIPFLLFNRSKQ